MDDFANPAELSHGSQKSPVLVIIEHHVLARTCILNILKRELTGFEIVEMATTIGLNWLSGRDIRLIALNIGDKQITDPSIEESLALLAESCPNAYVALLSNRDDEATAAAALQRGVSVVFFRPRSRSMSLSPDCALFLPVGSTDHYRLLDKMKHRASRRYRSLPTLPGYPQSMRVTAQRRSCPRGRWSTLHPANNTCSRR